MAKHTKPDSETTTRTYDDLTAIKGIRDARQQWFRETMKVRTYLDLATLSVDQIEAGLKAEKQFPSRSMIAAWIAQARALAEDAENPAQQPNRKVTTEVPRWEPLASFVIEFQEIENKDGSRQQRTTVHHIETDKNQMWFGIEQHQSMQWMLSESNIEIQSPSLTQPAGFESQPDLPAHPLSFSDKLQKILAKTTQITGSPPPESLPASIDPMSTKIANAAQSLGFSERMQEVLNRTRHLTTNES